MVLIAGPMSQLLSSHNRRLWTLIEPCPSFSGSTDSKKPSESVNLPDYYTFYSRELDRVIKKYHDTKTSVEDLSFICLLPLLHVRLDEVRIRSIKVKDRLAFPETGKEGSVVTSLYDKRSSLRCLTNELQDDWSSVLRYMRSCFTWDPSGKSCYQGTEANVTDIVQLASRLEGHIRENLQLQTGKLALEESKKSIEVSNQQIGESKRGRYTLVELLYVWLIVNHSQNL